MQKAGIPVQQSAGAWPGKQAFNADQSRCTQNTQMEHGPPHLTPLPKERCCPGHSERPCGAPVHPRVPRASACICVKILACLLASPPAAPPQLITGLVRIWISQTRLDHPADTGGQAQHPARPLQEAGLRASPRRGISNHEGGAAGTQPNVSTRASGVRPASSALPRGAATLVSGATGRHIPPADGRHHEQRPAVLRPGSALG